MSSKYEKAIGIMSIDVGGVIHNLHPKMGDNRKFRRILMNEQYKKDKIGMMEKFEEFMYDLIKRDYQEEKDDDIKMFIEYNCEKLFEKLLIAFNYTTEEELEKAKKESLGDIKKLIGES